MPEIVWKGGAEDDLLRIHAQLDEIFYTVEARGIIIHALLHLRQDLAGIREKIRRLLGME